ncbi:MAG: LacI family DNA-binding transcriptional regulator [Candidatus Limiplasma sp.]|nr:LacI family DNA-binding transcriptional regulator [Candidatus Limiplasma sp.]MEA5145069.1 LacI family DNA-binding transcriptional regulator [Candidatus Limiplasma sp.]
MANYGIRDVAKHAGVSIATVSHVLNNTRFVTEETRNRVKEAIQTLGYQPNAIARSLKTRRYNLIAFVVPDIANAFFATLIEEVENTIAEKGYRLIVVNTKETKTREIENLRALANGIVDGFIIASTLSNYADIAKVVPADVPTVFIDRSLPMCPCDTITVTNYAAMYQGVSHLIRMGHRNIGYITGLPRISTTAERLKAYQAAMDAEQLPTEGLVRIGDSMSTCVATHLDELLHAKCTALVVSNNVMATEAMLQLMDRGLKASDIDILGYKDSEQAQYGLQHMHLITQPTIDLARAAGRQILERIENPSLPIRQTVIQAVFTPKKK